MVAFALEMFGIPMSLYIASWVLGRTLPEGVLWGHTLVRWIGLWGMYVGAVAMIAGAVLVVLGWRIIHRRYWGKKEGQGHLVTEEIYRYLRHPQYPDFS